MQENRIRHVVVKCTVLPHCGNCATYNQNKTVFVLVGVLLYRTPFHQTAATIYNVNSTDSLHAVIIIIIITVKNTLPPFHQTTATIYIMLIPQIHYSYYY